MKSMILTMLEHKLKVGKVWTEQSRDLVLQGLKSRDLNDSNSRQRRCEDFVSKANKVGMGKVMMPLRYAVSGTDTGASLDRTLELG